MRLFRRGDYFLVLLSDERAYLYDAVTDSATRESHPNVLLGDTAREWEPVLDDSEVPAGLLQHLIIPFPDRS